MSTTTTANRDHDRSASTPANPAHQGPLTHDRGIKLGGPPGMAHLAAIAATSAVILLVAACAAQSSVGAGPSDPPIPPQVVSSGPLPPGGTASASASQSPNIASAEPAVDLRRERWTRAEPVTGEAEVLIHTTLSGGPPCSVLGRVEVAETADQVTVTLWVGRQAEAQCDGPQPQLAYPLVTRVQLAAPVGKRQVRDGAS